MWHKIKSFVQNSVIPAKAGIHVQKKKFTTHFTDVGLFTWIPAFAGMTLLALCAILLLSQSARATEAIRYDDFAAMPVQHEGRIKPLNTLALVALQKFSGSTRMADMSADAWLAEVLFDPATAVDRPLFLVKNPDARAMLRLADAPDHRYAFSQLAEVMQANRAMIAPLLEQTQRTPEQRAVVDLYEHVQLFSQMTLSMTPYLAMALPMDEAQRQQYGLPVEDVSFIENFRFLPVLQTALKKLVARKGSDVKRYTPAELQLALTAQKLALTQESGRGNDLLRILPPAWGKDDAWASPWGAFFAGAGAPQTVALTQQWQQLSAAYRSHDAAAWNATSKRLKETMLETRSVRPLALTLEMAYYHYAPLGKAMALYIVGFVLTLLCVAGVPQMLSYQRRLVSSNESWVPHRSVFQRLAMLDGKTGLWHDTSLRFAALSMTSLAVMLHILSIVMRVMILQRPPVGTLYESILFVAGIATAFGVFLELRLRNCLGLLVATVSGSVLLLASQSFADGDTMSMLIAVLNTNFWLATHVLCISTGYGFGFVAGIIAHGYLLLRCRNRDAAAARSWLRSAYGATLIALLFTSLGTILGGIWADQSWGRFWGWDPKENGALVICLWIIWLLHGRITKQLGEVGFAAGLALLNMVIALSWFGVNLLSTGLHSYGFTDKAAWALGAFCAAELAFAGVTYFILKRRGHA